MRIFPIMLHINFSLHNIFLEVGFVQKKKTTLHFFQTAQKPELTTTSEHMQSDSKTLFWFLRPLRELWELHKNVTRDMSGTLHWSSVVELSQPGDTKCSSLSLTKPVTLWMSSAKDFLHVYCLETQHFGKNYAILLLMEKNSTFKICWNDFCVKFILKLSFKRWNRHLQTN